MIATLSKLPGSGVFWIVLIVLSFSLELIGLYYQYQLNYLPCVLCIHVRMLLMLILIVSMIGLLWKRSRLVCIGLVTLLWFWMLERSWQTLGTEMGWILGECEMTSGLPSWLALEKWLPWIFEIHEPCGYTPYLLFNITMAQALIALSAVLSGICLVSLILSTYARRSSKESSTSHDQTEEWNP